jgi:hypothetical protein
VYLRTLPGVRFSANAVIAEAKLRGYLLARRKAEDKSLFLEKAGFTSANWWLLEAAIRKLASNVPPFEAWIKSLRHVLAS